MFELKKTFCGHFLQIKLFNILFAFCIIPWRYFINTHCVKSVRIRSYSGPHFPAFRLIQRDIPISPYSVLMRENARQNNSNRHTFYAVIMFFTQICRNWLNNIISTFCHSWFFNKFVCIVVFYSSGTYTFCHILEDKKDDDCRFSWSQKTESLATFISWIALFTFCDNFVQQRFNNLMIICWTTLTTNTFPLL